MTELKISILSPELNAEGSGLTNGYFYLPTGGELKVKIVFLCCLVCLGFFLCDNASAAAGHSETVSWWRGVVSQTSQYRQLLQDLYAQTEYQSGPNKSRLNAEFSKALARQYPGSKFYGSFGQLAINNYTMITFDSRWNINMLRQHFGSLNKTYDFRDQSFEVVNGPNRIKLKLDLNRPDRSLFTFAEIPAITATAQRIWARKGSKQKAPLPLRDILNDAYFNRIANDGTRMDELAEQMVESEATRRDVLNAAEGLYSHPSKSSVSRPSSKAFSSNRSTSLFDFLPWFFFPALFGISFLKVLTSGKSRRPNRKRSSAYSGRSDFSMGKVLKSSGIKLGKRPKPSSHGGDQIFSMGFPDSVIDEPPIWSLDVLASLEWKRFETICAEYLRLIGFDPRETRIGADGGVDIWVYKEGLTKPVGVVQCKAWTTYKVGIKPVRELFGVMAAEGVRNGKFMTSGEFTSEAVAFAEGKRLQLISGEKLLASIKRLPQEKQNELLNIALEGDYRTPTCPQCGYKLTRRQGKGGGRDFWGCPRYPKCKATLVYKG